MGSSQVIVSAAEWTVYIPVDPMIAKPPSFCQQLFKDDFRRESEDWLFSKILSKLLKVKKVLTSKWAKGMVMSWKKLLERIVETILRKARVPMFLMTQEMICSGKKNSDSSDLKVIQSKNWTWNRKMFEECSKFDLFVFFHECLLLIMKMSVCK